MNTDDVVVSTSDYETSEATASSLNNSLSEEEFAIESSNFETGGLKLTISCRKKSCDNDGDKSRTNMSQQELGNTNKYDSGQNGKDAVMDSPSLPDGNQAMAEDGRCDDQRAIQAEVIAVSSSSDEIHPRDLSATCPSVGSNVQHVPSSALTDEDNPSPRSQSNLELMSLTGSTDPPVEELPAQQKVSPPHLLEPIRSVELVKKVKAPISSAMANSQEPHDPLIRLDNHPNVSPDSGIISLDESTFGNDSPGPVASVSDPVTDPQCQQSAPMPLTLIPYVFEKKDGMDGVLNASTAEISGDKCVGSNVRMDSSCNAINKTCNASLNSQADTTRVSVSSMVNKDVIVREVDRETNLEKFSVYLPVKTSPPLQQSVSHSEVVSTVLDSVSSASSISNSSGIIVSSPQKISQATGRKKSGRPPKQTKTLLLKHKKSTLYSSMYTSNSVEPVSKDNNNSQLDSTIVASVYVPSTMKQATSEKDPVSQGKDTSTHVTSVSSTLNVETTDKAIEHSGSISNSASVHSGGNFGSGSTRTKETLSSQNCVSETKDGQRSLDKSETIEAVSSEHPESQNEASVHKNLAKEMEDNDNVKPVKRAGRPKGSFKKLDTHVPYQRTFRQTLGSSKRSKTTTQNESISPKLDHEQPTNISEKSKPGLKKKTSLFKTDGSPKKISKQIKREHILKKGLQVGKGNRTKLTTLKTKLNSKNTNEEVLTQLQAPKIKRPRGRPRKNPLLTDVHNVSATNNLPTATNKVQRVKTNIGAIDASVKRGIIRRVKRKCGRKRFFTRRKKKNASDDMVDSIKSSEESLPMKSTYKRKPQSGVLTKKPQSVPKPTVNSSEPVKLRLDPPVVERKNGDPPEKSVFQDNDLDALLKSVHSSIHSQFPVEEDPGVITPPLSFGNPFSMAHPPMFPKVAQTGEAPVIVKPKPKKPKLHVMMRQTKRKKRRKVPLSKPIPPVTTTAPVIGQRKMGMFSTVSPQRRFSKLMSNPPQKSTTGMFGTSTSHKRLSFFSSRVQPSKILASSRLNVFQSGTGVDSQYRLTDEAQSDGSDKRGKKRHRLLYRKSKHKNIVDPVFAADLDMLLAGINGMTIADGSGEKYIRVRPGEMPLPTIFRVIKIDVNRRLKEKILPSEFIGLEKAKIMKGRKETPSPQDQTQTAFKRLGKTGKKKSLSEVQPEQPENSCISDSSDQCLPPKKRHRLVNLDSTDQPAVGASTSSSTSSEPKEEVFVKKRGRKPRKLMQEKMADRPGLEILGQHFVGEQLTIDTSSYSTGPSSNITPSPSSCPSRLSTRSSTLHSLSSPSPNGATGRRPSARRLSHLACPVHALCSTPEEKASCAECQLLLHSASPGAFRSRRNSGSTISNTLSAQVVSSGEPSPVLRSSQPTADKGSTRGVRKRRKSSNLSGYESDSSPPRLEKTTSLSPTLPLDCEVFSEPPEITSSPTSKTLPHSPYKLVAGSKGSQLSPNEGAQHHPQFQEQLSPSSVKSSSLRSPKRRSLRPSSLSQTVVYKSQTYSGIGDALQSTSLSEYEPLPLEHCTKRKLVEEMKAALNCDSAEEDLSSDDNEASNDLVQQSTGQPPRKRFQRVGLFSDFYKDEEPRKRCENMVRCRDKLVYVREEHEFGLMPQPLHIGQHYMRMIQDFQLPYDIWWQMNHQQLPKRPESKVKFRTIRTNVYSDSKVSSRKLENPLCSCKPPTIGGVGCQDDCLNRMIYTECSPSSCPSGENCGNQRIQKHDWAPGLEKFQTKDRGFGVRTTQPIKNGQFILEYLGEVISETELRRRLMEEYSEERHHYALHLDSGCVIDGYRMGNIGRYVNHSCRPNCEMQKWNVNGLYRMVLFALRDIQPGEELGYDYNFDPFNQETQQECRCGSAECRGLIGGKTQRNSLGNGKMEKAEDSKDKRKNKLMNRKSKNQSTDSVQVQPMAKPMTLKERCYARKHRTFLVRNVDKVRNQRHPNQDYPLVTKEELNPIDCGSMGCLPPDLMLAHLNERSVKTRLAAFAKDNPEMARKHQLAQIFDKMLTELLSLKDEDGDSQVTALMSLPSRKKQPQYYQVVRKPIDMSMIKQRVKIGYYDHLSAFHDDLMLLFSNVELYCGPKSDLGQIILKLRRIFSCVKQDVAAEIDELLGPNTTKNCVDIELEKLEHALCKGHEEPEEDIIRCICGVTRDEGLMLQCEKCLRWQHCDCVQASGKEEHYLCDRCEPRYYDPEIHLVPSPSDALPDCTYFMTLVKDDLQYAIGDCVYVMRDCKRTASGTPLRSSHRLMASANPDKLDIFRIEQLWKDPKGERFASGTPYLRPQETFHEPTRKFYHNELFRTPNFEIIPMDLVMGKCVVMDPNTYCKGRPKGVKEQDVYICEYRVDKTAHLFHKIQKIWYPINTGKFCFDWFEKRLTLRRTFSPHEVPEEYKRKAERNMAAVKVDNTNVKIEGKQDVKKCSVKNQGLLSGKVRVDDSIKNDLKLKAEVKVTVKKGSGAAHNKMLQTKAEDSKYLQKLKEEKIKQKKQNLDKIMMKLLSNVPGKQRIDLTYLLEDGKRIRKKLVK